MTPGLLLALQGKDYFLGDVAYRVIFTVLELDWGLTLASIRSLPERDVIRELPS